MKRSNWVLNLKEVLFFHHKSGHWVFFKPGRLQRKKFKSCNTFCFWWSCVLWCKNTCTLRIERWITWRCGTIVGFWWWNWTVPKRVLKILRNPGSTEIQENFATAFKRGRAPLQQRFCCVATVNGLEIRRKFRRLFSWASNETHNLQKYLTMAQFPLWGTLTLEAQCC